MTSGRRLIGVGAAAGLLAWLYDYQFFLNAGGPPARMSTAILTAAGLNSSGPLVIVFFPLAVMMAIGAAAGFAAALASAPASRR